ncbi:TOBE domain-containing protein [Halorarum halophilum]|uniref:TOBE domain-containing protein n=1 Tax=Halorarum halophilum TaxID=2743090 RepID=A0A7D5GN90_9EURY|nr:TOBE domain-containing protein [Halobaculum halophilum]QLG29227.1 TOBE domain-containing protein [Halobaculum halophilum]
MHDPENLFVADFIGSPSPNLFDCQVATNGGSVRLESDEFTLEPTPEQADALRDRAGDHVVFGIRPEYLDLTTATGDFEAAVDVVEPLGDRDAVHLSIGEKPLSAVTQQGQVSRGTDRLAVDVDVGEGWVFSPDGDRLV